MSEAAHAMAVGSDEGGAPPDVGATRPSLGGREDLMPFTKLDEKLAQIEEKKKAQNPMSSDVKRQEMELLRNFIIPPRKKEKIIWDLVVGGLILFSVIVVPWRIGFDRSPEPGGFGDILDWIIDVFFALDIVFNFRTAYYDKHGILITDTRQIRKSYLKGFFLIDFLSTVPFDRILPVGRQVGPALLRKDLPFKTQS